MIQCHVTRFQSAASVHFSSSYDTRCHDRIKFKTARMTYKAEKLNEAKMLEVEARTLRFEVEAKIKEVKQLSYVMLCSIMSGKYIKTKTAVEDRSVLNISPRVYISNHV